MYQSVNHLEHEGSVHVTIAKLLVHPHEAEAGRAVGKRGGKWNEQAVLLTLIVEQWHFR